MNAPELKWLSYNIDYTRSFPQLTQKKQIIFTYILYMSIYLHYIYQSAHLSYFFWSNNWKHVYIKNRLILKRLICPGGMEEMSKMFSDVIPYSVISIDSNCRVTSVRIFLRIFVWREFIICTLSRKFTLSPCPFPKRVVIFRDILY